MITTVISLRNEDDAVLSIQLLQLNSEVAEPSGGDGANELIILEVPEKATMNK